MKKILFIDLETTGLPTSHHIDPIETHHWPYIVEISWLLTDYDSDKVLKDYHEIIKPEGYEIPEDSTKIHQITQQKAIEYGLEIKIVLDELIGDLKNSTILVAHNLDFDANVLRAAFYRLGYDIDVIDRLQEFCTMQNFTDYCAIPHKDGYGYKWPTLDQLHQKVLGSPMIKKHSALADVYATKLCFYKLKSEKFFDIFTDEELEVIEENKKLAVKRKERKDIITFASLFVLAAIFIILISSGVEFFYCLMITLFCWGVYYFYLSKKIL